MVDGDDRTRFFDGDLAKYRCVVDGEIFSEAMAITINVQFPLVNSRMSVWLASRLLHYMAVSS